MITSSSLGDAGLLALKHFDRLEHLTIRDGQFTPQGLEGLRGLKQLRRVELHGVR